MFNPFIEKEGDYQIFRIPWTIPLKSEYNYFPHRLVDLMYFAAEKTLNKHFNRRESRAFDFDGQVKSGFYSPSQTAIVGIQGGKGIIENEIELKGDFTRIFLPPAGLPFSWVRFDLTEKPEYFLFGVARWCSPMKQFLESTYAANKPFLSFCWSRDNWKRLNFFQGGSYIDDFYDLIFNWIKLFLILDITQIVMNFIAEDQLWSIPSFQGRRIA